MKRQTNPVRKLRSVSGALPVAAVPKNRRLLEEAVRAQRTREKAIVHITHEPTLRIGELEFLIFRNQSDKPGRSRIVIDVEVSSAEDGEIAWEDLVITLGQNGNNRHATLTQVTRGVAKFAIDDVPFGEYEFVISLAQ